MLDVQMHCNVMASLILYQGAIDATLPETNIRVTHGDTPEPLIQICQW